MPIPAMDRKVTVGLASNATVTVLAFVAKQFFDIELSADVALAAATVITFLLQYHVPNAEEPPTTGGTPSA